MEGVRAYVGRVFAYMCGEEEGKDLEYLNVQVDVRKYMYAHAWYIHYVHARYLV